MSKPWLFLLKNTSVCGGDELKQKEGLVCNIEIYLTATLAHGYLVATSMQSLINICSAKAGASISEAEIVGKSKTKNTEIGTLKI